MVSAVAVLITFAFVAEEIRAFFSGLLKLPRAFAHMAKPLGRSDADASVLARPLMFMFLLTWALPLSFVPLYARSLPIVTGNLPSELAMALPTSAEMACAFCTTLLSGWLSDRRGWHVPVFLGLLASAVGALTSAIATNFEWFVLSRAMTGLGYGLTWMGIQGFVVRRSATKTLTFSIANMTAGIFTGHMVGTILGGFLAETNGYATVFAIGAAGTLAPALYATAFLRRFIQRPDASPSSPRGPAGNEFLRLLSDRDFLWLLGASVIPFSVAQVGLLYYAIPIFLEADGFKVSAIAQVLAIYSATLVFVAPSVARYVDRFVNKKLFIAAGGLLGGCSLLTLFAAQDVILVIIAVAMLGVASSIGGAAQTSYALQLRQVQRCGPAMATSIQRAADKFGQMLGPLLMGSLFAGAGMANGIALAGGLYLLASVFFVIFARPGSSAPVDVHP